MERLKITPEEAFDVLRYASQRLNVKLHELARGVSETGQLPTIPESRSTTRERGRESS